MRPLRCCVALFALAAFGLAGCAGLDGPPADTAGRADAAPPAAAPPGGARERVYVSDYRPRPAPAVVFRDVTLLTGTGSRRDHVDVHIAGGRIAAIGSALAVTGAREVHAAGAWLTPGIIDVHSHLGNYPAPSVEAHSDGNEMTDPNTAEVWAEHGVWPQDPQFSRALAGGVTTLQILPGSANLFGGRGVTLKNVPGRTVYDMRFPGAPHALKMACGENPKRVYGAKGRLPSSRMGNVAGYRKAWIDARAYLARQRDAAAGTGDPPKQDIQLDTLVGVLRGEILVHNHCYRADEMRVMIEIAREFDYRITAFHHAVEAYKLADLLASEGICSAMWADWWAFKMESLDGVEGNVALVDAAGACAIVHSDSAIDIQRLNQEAAKALAAARRLGMDLDEAHAIGWITLNPARALGIASETGSIEPGKAADVVLWDGNPLSVYSRAEQVYIDGYRYFDRAAGLAPVSDFELGRVR